MLGVPVISLPTGQRLTGVAVGSFPETDPIRSCSVRHVISQSRKLSSRDKSQMHFSPALVHLSCRIKKSWSPEPLPSSSIFILTGISEDQPQTTPPRKHKTMNPLEFKGHVVTTVFFSFLFFKASTCNPEDWISWSRSFLYCSQMRSGFCEWNCRHLRQFVNSHCDVGIYKLLLLNHKSPLRKVPLLSFCFVLVRLFFF